MRTLPAAVAALALLAAAVGCGGGTGTCLSCADASASTGDASHGVVPEAGAPDADAATGVAPGHTLVQLYPGLGGTGMSLALDATHAYLGSFPYGGGAGSLVQVPLAGGSAVTLVSNEYGFNDLAVDATDVYWPSGDGATSPDGGASGAVMRTPIAGGPSTVVAPATALTIAVDDASVYWIDQPQCRTFPCPANVMRVSNAGGTPTVLASAGNNAYRIVVDAANLYWFANDSGIARIFELAKAGGKPTQLAEYETYVTGFAVDATSIYWGNGAGDVMKTPIAGGASTALAMGQDVAPPMAADGTSVYWVTNQGDVMKIPALGGAPSTLYVRGHAGTTIGYSVAIAVDATSVYLATGSGSLLKITPK
jgi:hypothetical protein